MKNKLLILAAMMIAIPIATLAQKVDDEVRGGLAGSVTDGAVTYEYLTFGGTDAANTNFTGASGGDDLFENWWFFRLPGDTQEFPFPDPDSAVYSGNTVTFTWANVSGRGFSAELVETVSDGGGPSGSILSTMTITELANSSLNIDIFAFADIDIGGTFGGDSATLSGLDFISFIDGANTGEYRAGGPDAVQAVAFPGLDPILSDTAVDNLDNSGFPFGPDDFTGAFQWTLSLGGEQSVELQTAIAINEAAPVPAAPNFSVVLPESVPVPALSAWALSLMLLAMLVMGVVILRKVRA